MVDTISSISHLVHNAMKLANFQLQSSLLCDHLNASLLSIKPEEVESNCSMKSFARHREIVFGTWWKLFLWTVCFHSSSSSWTARRYCTESPLKTCSHISLYWVFLQLGNICSFVIVHHGSTCTENGNYSFLSILLLLVLNAICWKLVFYSNSRQQTFLCKSKPTPTLDWANQLTILVKCHHYFHNMFRFEIVIVFDILHCSYFSYLHDAFRLFCVVFMTF
jgi:hypothetical protein